MGDPRMRIFAKTFSANLVLIGAAAIALWYCLRLILCGHGFKSQTHLLHFFQFVLLNCNEKRTKIKKKRLGLAHF